MTVLQRVSIPVDGIPAWEFALRVLGVAAQVIAVVCLGEQGLLFFYQGF
jgi:hypothetical protein